MPTPSPLSPAEEQELIDRARQGSLGAFNRLVEAHQRTAYNVAYRVTGDSQRAADATQEAFISAYLHLSDFRGGSFRAWLLRIVSNACYDNLRRARVRAAESLEELTEAGLDPIAGEEGPESGALRAEARRALRDCLGSLPLEQRTVIVLSDIQGASYQEVSETLELSLGTVKSRLSRAREKMRDCLAGSGLL